ncbi:MAG: hypothetical protein E7474_12985 [Ruminococcaceae bacterium]|nr:hypothetical protein [Oscillospiraceae bacterium]
MDELTNEQQIAQAEKLACLLEQKRRDKRKKLLRLGAAAAFALAVLALMLTAGVSFVRRHREIAETEGCRIAVNEAQRKIVNAEVNAGGGISEEEAKLAATQDTKPWSQLCPGGGDCYLLPDKDGYFTVVCALHDPDEKQRTRLNAESAFEQIQKKLDTERLQGREVPKAIRVTLNGKALDAARTNSDIGLSRGTKYASNYDGVIAFYLVNGETLQYFFYADEEHCAVWNLGVGWTGDSWS